jgi:succinate dehydrogenase / fumarate reductase cytochrome b subunit
MTLLKYCKSSIGKKQIMATTSIMLCGFVVIHLLGNLFMFAGPRAFNMYSYSIGSNKAFLYTAEVALFMIFFVHASLAGIVTLDNRRARPERYFLKVKTGRGATLASSTMAITGSIILIFLFFHVWHFRLGHEYHVNYAGLEVRDLYRSVIERFQDPFYIFFYVAAMVALGVHLSHGVQSAFQTYGFRHHRYTPVIKLKGMLFAILIATSFSIFPIWAFMQGGQ